MKTGEGMSENLKLDMTVDEALAFAEEWTRGMTLHAGLQGWRVVCLLLGEEVKALREENERLAIDRNGCQERYQFWHQKAATLESQLVELRDENECMRANSDLLRQGGEAVGEVVLESMGVGDAKVVRFHMYKEIPPVGTKLFTRPQPAIPPGYAVVPVEPTRAMQDAWDTAGQHEDLDEEFAKAYRAMIASAPSVPVAEKDESQRVYAECRQCYRCNHIGINDAHDTHSSCHDCDWNGPSPEEDHCPACHADGTMMAACPKCSGTYELQADAYIDAAMLAAHADSKEGEK